MEPGSAELYRRFGLNRRQLELIAFATPKRAYYWRQPQGRRLFDLKLSGVGLAFCGASSPDDHALIDAVLERSGPDGFARAFLPHEFAQFGVSLDESRRRFTEGLAQIRLLLSGESVSSKGEFHSFRDVTSLPRPTWRSRTSNST